MAGIPQGHTVGGWVGLEAHLQMLPRTKLIPLGSPLTAAQSSDSPEMHSTRSRRRCETEVGGDTITRQRHLEPVSPELGGPLPAAPHPPGPLRPESFALCRAQNQLR